MGRGGARYYRSASAERVPRTGSDEVRELAEQGRLRPGADDLLHDLASLEHAQRGDVHDPVPLGGDRILVDVQLDHVDLVGVLAGDLLENRRDSLRASKIMQDRALANPKIKFAWDSEVVEVLGEDRISGVRIRNVRTGAASTLPLTGIFVAIGHDPRSELFAGQLATDPDGYLLVEQPSTRTAIEGVFAAGDVVDRTYRQAVTAAGTGCAAALDAERWLADQES